MGKQTISPEILKAIEASVNKAAKKVTEIIEHKYQEIDKSKTDYYKKTEQLLYAYPALKKRLRNGIYCPGERSKDVIRISNISGDKKDRYDVLEEIYESRVRSYERTKAQVEIIESALEQVRSKEGYIIIEMRYFEGKSMQEVVEIVMKELHCSESTVKRLRRKLINEIKILIFGADSIQT